MRPPSGPPTAYDALSATTLVRLGAAATPLGAMVSSGTLRPPLLVATIAAVLCMGAVLLIPAARRRIQGHTPDLRLVSTDLFVAVGMNVAAAATIRSGPAALGHDALWFVLVGSAALVTLTTGPQWGLVLVAAALMLQPGLSFLAGLEVGWTSLPMMAARCAWVAAAVAIALLVRSRLQVPGQARQSLPDWVPPTEALRTLSRREREVLALVALGLRDRDIAAELTISVRTVESHLDRIRRKTGHRRRADLVRLALGADRSTGASSG